MTSNERKNIEYFYLVAKSVFVSTITGFKVTVDCHCCGATVGSEQQHNQDLREIYKVRRILEFITFLPECFAFNQSALRYLLPECIAPRTTQIQTRVKGASFAVQTQSFFVANFLQHD